MFEQKVRDTLIALRDCLEDKFEERGWERPCFLDLYPGDAVALNYALGCDAGQAWVRLVGIAPPEDQVVVSTADCFEYLTMTFEMGIIRAAPVGTADGEPPTESEQYATTLQQIADAAAMFEVMQQCALPEDEKVTGSNYQPYGPDGGAIGGTWTGMVRIF